jgi:hypothetical protein
MKAPTELAYPLGRRRPRRRQRRRAAVVLVVSIAVGLILVAAFIWIIDALSRLVH